MALRMFHAGGLGKGSGGYELDMKKRDRKTLCVSVCRNLSCMFASRVSVQFSYRMVKRSRRTRGGHVFLISFDGTRSYSVYTPDEEDDSIPCYHPVNIQCLSD